MRKIVYWRRRWADTCNCDCVSPFLPRICECFSYRPSKYSYYSQMRTRARVCVAERGSVGIMQVAQRYSCNQNWQWLSAHGRVSRVDARQSVGAQVCVCLLGKVEGEAILSNRHLEINGRKELSPPSLSETESRIFFSGPLPLPSSSLLSSRIFSPLHQITGACLRCDHMLSAKVQAQQRFSMTYESCCILFPSCKLSNLSSLKIYQSFA